MKTLHYRRVFCRLLAATLCLATGALLFGCMPQNGDVVNTLPPTEEPGPTPEPRNTENDTTLAASMVYANDAANQVSMRYDTSKRQNMIVKNMDSLLNIRLSGSDTRGLYSITTKKGVPFIEGGMTGYVTTNDGSRYITSASGSSARINGNKIGYYYYEVNIRDLNFVLEGSLADATVPYDREITGIEAGSLHGNQITDIALKNGVLSAKVTETSDPYLVVPVNTAVQDSNILKLDMAIDGSASGCTVYYYTFKQGGFSGDRRFSFSITPDGEYHTYLIDLSDAGIAGETMGEIRIDLDGASVDTVFRVRSLKFSKTDKSFAIPCGFEQTIHAYSDKYHNELRLLYDENVENLSEFGFEYKIPVDKVASVQFETATGTHTALTDFDGKTLAYIGFDIKDSGVFGIIIPSDGLSNASLTQADGCYVLRTFIDITGRQRGGKDSIFGHRIFYSEKHGFEDIAREAYIERNPLEVSADTLNSSSKFKYVQYDKVRGAYKFELAGIGFSEAYDSMQNDYFGGTVSFTGDGKYDRKLYVWTNGESGSLEAAVVLDDRMVLTPIQVEVCKNFAGEKEEPYYDPTDAGWGDSYYPLVVKKGETLTHTVMNLYQNWGLNKLKQISSISFHISYYHLSTGVTESNCIAPYFVFGRDGWTLPDFRGASAPMWASQPQHNSVGRLRFLSYVNEKGEKLRSEYIGGKISSSGPTYADVEYDYRSDCSSFEYSLRHVEFPQDDENRTYYQMDIVVHRDITIKDVRNKFTLFDFDGRSQAYMTLSYKASDGTVKEVSNDIMHVNDPELFVLDKDTPFFSYYYYDTANSSGADTMNFALLVKDYSVTIGGKAWDGNLVLRNSTFMDGNMLNLAELSLDLGDTAFKAGDRISLTFILLPYGVALQQDDQNVHYVYDDSIANPWRIKSAAVGTPVPDPYLASVNCVNNEAEFTVTGGRNANVVRVNGFTNLVVPRLQEKINGEWQDVDFSFEKYDGYQVNYTFDGNYSYSFVIYMENPLDERTFRVTAWLEK